MKYFRFNFKKACNLGKLYLLSKIHNCGTPSEKVSEFPDSHIQPIMRKDLSYIKDSGDFISKIKRIGSVPEIAIIVTADVVGLYRSIPHDVGLKALKQALVKREQKKIQQKIF